MELLELELKLSCIVVAGRQAGVGMAWVFVRYLLFTGYCGLTCARQMGERHCS